MGTLWGWSFWDANFTAEGRLGGALVRQKESKNKENSLGGRRRRISAGALYTLRDKRNHKFFPIGRIGILSGAKVFSDETRQHLRLHRHE